MKTYLVGGAVRDKLLKYPVKEHDWLVVGATVEEMLAKGFRPVGKDFPVFLHPKTHEEYALARTERKTAPGYHGFTIHAAPEVTIEEDLIRRDLTINAIAEDAEGSLVDPYGGCTDLNKKLLRHVSPSFCEDPVRVLRVARFYARYAHLGFTVASETKSLMEEMVLAGEVDALVPERVWAEFDKALGERSPELFIELLRETGALKKLMPEVDRLFGVRQSIEYHPEIDAGLHTLMVLKQSVRLSELKEVRFAALVHDLGKGVTPQSEWPHHYRHETTGLAPLKQFCSRLRVPNSYRSLAEVVMRYHLNCHCAFELKASTIVDMLQSLKVLKPNQEARLDHFLAACLADARGRLGKEESEYPQIDYLKSIHSALLKVDSKILIEQGLEGAAIGQALRQMRILVVKKIKQDYIGKNTIV
jgi:tRNA nucleotidyltransferase (CCA-adding enzyme)